MAIWTNSKKSSLKVFSGFLISLLVVTLVFSMNTRVALADDYTVTWYSASQNPVSGSFNSSNTRFLDQSIDNVFYSADGNTCYVDFRIRYCVRFSFTGFVTGYTYRYAPNSWLAFSLPANFPIANYSLDSIFLDKYSLIGSNISQVNVIQDKTSTTESYTCPIFIRFDWDWLTMNAGSTEVRIDIDFLVRAYCSTSVALSVTQLGALTFSGTLGKWGNTDTFFQQGAYIANFSMIAGSASQFNNSNLMAGYLYDIRNALIQDPDTDYTAALDSAQSALDTEQSARDDVFQQVDQFYMTDADTLLTLDDIDSNVGVGLDFWFDWVNAYFNKAEEVDANKPLTLNIIFNFISRLF